MDDLAQLQARYERLNLLYQVSNVIHSTLEPQEALQLILKEAVRLMRASSRSAVLLDVNGELRGVLNVDSDRLEAFSPADQELLEALAAQAARVIHNTWLYEQLRLKARLFESLASVSQTINSTLNLDDALSAITRESCVLMQARMCSLMLL